jgi:hypothetical protein
MMMDDAHEWVSDHHGQPDGEAHMNEDRTQCE